MSTLQDLVDKRSAAWAQAQSYNSRTEAGADLTEDDEVAWQRALAEVDSLGTQIETRQKTAELDKRFAKIDDDQAAITHANGPDDGDKAHRDAFISYLRKGPQGLSPEQMGEMQSRAAQSTLTGAAGGYTVPQGFWDKVTETLKFYAPVAQVAEVITTDTGNTLPWPTNNDTSNTGRLLTENTQLTETDLTFGQAQLGAYTFTSDLVLASLQILQDTGVDIESFLAKKIGQRIGRSVNSYYTTGTGSSQPQGYITGATTGKTCASSTAFTFPEIVDLVHSVDVAYRMNAKLAVHDLVLAAIRKLLDSQNRPLWEPSNQVGDPDTVYGYPMFVNNNQASALTTGQKIMAFGDFEAAFAIRNVKEMTLMRLAERYADYLQVGFFGFSRSDSVVQDTSAVKLMVLA